ncbi:hypothetical protein Tco_0464491 [Tanacetum coccineum]
MNESYLEKRRIRISIGSCNTSLFNVTLRSSYLEVVISEGSSGLLTHKALIEFKQKKFPIRAKNYQRCSISSKIVGLELWSRSSINRFRIRVNPQIEIFGDGQEAGDIVMKRTSHTLGNTLGLYLGFGPRISTTRLYEISYPFLAEIVSRCAHSP